MYARQPRQINLFDATIAELAAKGVFPNPFDCVWLYDAAAKAIGDDCPALLDVPVPVGNTVLYPLTIGASRWWRDCGEGWYAQEQESNIVGLAFAMAHSKDAKTFERLRSKVRSDLALVAWQLSLSTSCTVNQLAWAVGKVYGQYDYVEINTPNARRVSSASGGDWGDIVAKLCAAYHQPPEYYLWSISEQAALELLSSAPRPFDRDQSDPAKARAIGEFFEVKRHLTAKYKRKAA
jgi:hypothetical protein